MVANTSYTRAKSTHYVYKMMPTHGSMLLSFTMKSSKHHSVGTRSGATIDAYNLSDLFNSLGFDTQCHDNKTHMH